MIQTLIGQKIDQAQNFLQNGKRIPVTEIAVSQNVVLQVKTLEKDNYQAVQIGAGFKKKPTKAFLGHVKKAGKDLTAPLKIREVSLENVTTDESLNAGDMVKVEAVFKPGDIVQVTGTSKGKGFAGVVKRHGFRGGPKTHGQSDRHRAPGSIGQGTTPGRVYKGKRMAGRMGTDTVTVKSLVVVDVDSELNKLYVAGLIPGHKNSWVTVTRTGEDKNFVPLLNTDEEETVVEEAANEETNISTESARAGQVKDETETVATVDETVDTAAETVEVARNTVEAPAGDSAEQNSKEVEIDEQNKEENAS